MPQRVGPILKILYLIEFSGVSMDISQENYTSAPIEEALFEVRVNYSEPYASSIDAFKKIMKEFCNYEELPQTRFHFKVAENNQPKIQDVPETQYLYRLRTADDKYVVQVSDVGLVVSRLRPYESWDIFEEKLLDCVSKFFEAFKVKSVNRVGLRFVNKMKCSPDEFYAYFKSFPSLAYGKFALEANASTMQFQVFNKEKALNGIITEIINPKWENETLSLVVTFDIDVFKNVSHKPIIAEIKAHLPDMRAMKNDVFEANITEEFRNRIRK